MGGKTTDAILLNAHFDTLLDSVGAADDAAGVGALVETLRALTHAAPLDRTIIVNLNGAEEIGLLGATAFLQHPWAKDVRAYVYLEALPGGKSVLIGAGPGNPWLARAYARSVPNPLGNAMAQELAQSGLLPFNGDFTPLHEAGLPGLDVAMVGDAWGVHTELDRLERLQNGGLQHMGDATLAVTRALASQGTRLDVTPERVVYYDLLGFTMLAYPMWVARLLGILALVCFGLLVVRARLARWISLRHLFTACAWNFLALGASLVAALIPAVILKLVLHRFLGWFGSPVLVLCCFALPAAAAMLFVHGRWRARALRNLAGDAHRVAMTAWLGGILFWAFWLLLATLGGAGTGYIALSWVVGGIAGLLVAATYPRAQVAGLLLALVPGAVVTIEVATMVVANLVPMAGMTPASAPTDLVIAVLVGMATGLVGVVACSLLHRQGGHGRAALICASMGLAGIVFTAAHAPYSAARPKRLLAVQTSVDDKSALLLASSGPDGMHPLLGAIPDATPAAAWWPSLDIFLPPFSHLLPAPAPAMPAPHADVTATSYDGATDTRQVRLHLDGTSVQLRLWIPAHSLLAWSVTPSLASVQPTDGRYVVHFEGVPQTGEDIQLSLRGQQPVALELSGIDGTRPTGAEIQALGKRLPDWVNLTTYAYRVVHLTI